MRQKIKQIADIQIGYQFRGKIKPAPKGAYRVIQIRNFDENRQLDIENLTYVKLTGELEKYKVKKDDVLFLSRGYKNFAVPVTEHLENTVVASYFFVLKILPNTVLPEYLAWYLNQPRAQKYIHNIGRRGTYIPVVPVSDFENLKIDIPDLQTQKQIVELNELLERENELLEELKEKRAVLIRSINMQAAKQK
jgi:restriction endonuclease S subunit